MCSRARARSCFMWNTYRPFSIAIRQRQGRQRRSRRIGRRRSRTFFIRTPRAMSERSGLRGMAWDHPRARGPLEVISAEWSREGGASIAWDARPLKDFEDQPLEELATAYDLILIDHPFVGFAATSKLLLPVEDWVDAAYLADQAANSVGPSYPSYTWEGKQRALAIDAACQVSALRDDLWSAASFGSLPDTW